jgi:hypothetical protein
MELFELLLVNEYVGDVTIPTKIIKYTVTNMLQADQPIRSQYSHQIKLYIIITYVKYKTCHHKQIILFVYKFHRRHNFEIF